MTAPRPGDVVTTREQWDALPVGTVVRSSQGSTARVVATRVAVWTDALFPAIPIPWPLVAAPWAVVSVPEPTPAEQDAQVSDEAVEAACRATGTALDDEDGCDFIERILTAAAPFIRAQGEREHRASALMDARDAWQQGQWANAPRRLDRVQERMANAQHVTDWLGVRAAAEREGGAL